MKPSFHVRFGQCAAALSSVCALFWSAVAQAQPTVSTIYPDGAIQFQPTNTLAFTISSATGVNPSSISVQLGATNLEGKGSSQLLTATNGLTITGTASMRVVTTSLTSNTVYTALIQATDSTGQLLSTNVFDTITPVYTWEAEDWDYEGGKFYDSPQTNAYSGLSGIDGVDAHNTSGGGTAYRSNDGGDLGNENNGDTPRVEYVSGGLTDYDVGWTAAGQWANYTRTYPTGAYYVIVRAAGNTGGTLSLAWVTSGAGTTNQTLGPALGTFTVPNTANWQIYTWAPLVDVAGNLLTITNTGKTATLRVTQLSGGYNLNFFMLMPVDPNYKPVPYVSAVSPDTSSQMFPYTNLFSFNANSVPGMSPSNVTVTANGITPYGLTLSGSGHVVKGSFPMALNAAYTVNIGLTDANGSSTYTTSFGTYSSSNYTWEAEDFDYNNGTVSGQYFDNPQIDSYAGLMGTDGVDAHNTSTGVGTAYRPADPSVLGNEVNGDLKRAQYVAVGTNDYDIGWTATGNWANYTRTYPKGEFNVIFRAAGNTGGNDSASLHEVTSGAGTPNQTIVELGRFNVPNSGNWQIYMWTPLVDANGNPVVVTNSGKVTTLRLNEDNGGWNGNFFMFVPVDTIKPVLSQIYPDGKAIFQRTNTLSFVVSSPIGIDTNLVTVNLNGVVLNNLVFSGSPTNWLVSWPNLQPDTAYHASIVANTTNNDSASISFFFDTFSSTDYTFEAEDFDHDSGKFYDNPQVDSYVGLLGIDGVDAHNTQATPGAAYRPNDPGVLGNEVTGDPLRAQYVTAGTNDYDIGWTAAGQWGNYTRTYPKGAYNVYLRAACPSGQAAGASLWQVTSGLGTPNQTTNKLGLFNFPVTGGYQTYTFVPMMDSSSNLVVITTSGAVSTFRLYQDTGGYNVNFLMLVPAVSRPALGIGLVNGKATITFTGTLQSSSTVNGSYQDVTGATSPYTAPTTGTATFYRSRQ